MKSTSLLLLLLGALPTTLCAQSRAAAGSPSARGELLGARPSGSLLARNRAQTATAASSDPVQQHLLASDVNLAQAGASQLPDLYERFISTTRDERRNWSYTDWNAAGEVLARLNQRYEQVRTELPLEERLRIRSLQGEFHTLRGARKVKDKFE